MGTLPGPANDYVSTAGATRDLLRLVCGWGGPPLRVAPLVGAHPGILELSRGPFEGHPLATYAVRCATSHTLLSGFRLPWPPSGCLDELTPFASRPRVRTRGTIIS